MLSRVGRQLLAGQGRHISGRPSRHELANREMLMRHTNGKPHQRERSLPAPSRRRLPTLSQTVRGHGHTPAAVSRWSKNRPRPPPRANMCASNGVTGYPRYASGPPRRAIAPRHSRRLCAATGTLPPPYIDGGKSITSPHLRHFKFRASLPTQEPHPHEGPVCSD